MQHFNPVDILWRALAIFLLIGASAGVVVSLLLIFKPHVVERVNKVANHWVSMRHISQMVDRSVSVERWFYRHHRLVGLFIVLGAGYMLAYFGWRFNQTTALQTFGTYVPNKLLLGMLLQAIVYFLLIGGAVALCVGLVVLLRPSLLKGVEAESNKWVSSRQATKVMDVQRGQVDLIVDRHAQRVGWLLLVGSIYLCFVMFRWLV